MNAYNGSPYSTRIRQIVNMVKENNSSKKISNEIMINKIGWVNWYD